MPGRRLASSLPFDDGAGQAPLPGFGGPHDRCELSDHSGLAAAALVRSLARRLSAVRQMMVWLVEERVRSENACRWIENPKLPTTLPKSLSEQEVVALIAADDYPYAAKAAVTAGGEAYYCMQGRSAADAIC